MARFKRDNNPNDTTDKKDIKSLDAELFKDSYEKLKNCVSRIQQSDIGNIDELVDLVSLASQAHKDCKERLETVRKLVNKTLEKD